MYDLVIRSGTIVDGTGRPSRAGDDVAVVGGRIVEIGRHLGPARREIDADGLLVTPGFVDVHTHYDGQATWDPLLTPSSWHGVTTVVIGNCGVGFAPVAPDRRQWLIELMESVEDIPGAALSQGIQWAWESFPEFLDALETMPRAVDVGTHVPHAALRAYVMGERGARNEPATAEDVAAMAAIVSEGIRAGALGVSSSRTMLHRTAEGEAIPGSFASSEELLSLGRAMRSAGGGVLAVASDVGIGGMEGRFRDDVDWMRRMALEVGVPVAYSLLQNDSAPEQWRELLDTMAPIRAQGGDVTAMVAGRPTGMLLGLQSSMHPFRGHPSFDNLAELPLERRVAELRKPEVKRRILAEETRYTGRFLRDVAHGFHKMYPLGTVPDYEPSPTECVAARAAAAGRDPYELCYELMLEDDGKAFLFFPLTDYAYGSLDTTWERLQRDDCVLSLSDGGAHCRLICDASMPTFMLTFWARDRDRGPQIPIERAVHLQTGRTAALYGMRDRGVVAAGMRADLNIIDHAALSLAPPEMVHDLPAGAPRLIQRARGYRATILRGEITFEHGEQTGARPGRLVRGAQAGPGDA